MKYTWKSVRSKILDYEGLSFEDTDGSSKKREITKTTIKHAIQLAHLLEDNGFTAPDIVFPRKYNGISFEWQKKTKMKQKCFQVTATSSRKISYFLDADSFKKGENTYVVICSKLDRTTSKKMSAPLRLTYESYKSDKNLLLLRNYDKLDKPKIYIGID